VDTYTSPHSPGPVQVVVQSVGTLHPDFADLLEDGLFFDLGTRLRNPHHDRALRYLTGLDVPVREHVLDTPGAREMVAHIAQCTRAVLAGHPGRHHPVHVTVACRGGRHRSVAVAEAVACSLHSSGIGVDVVHRHIGLPVVEQQ
jgi:UPF0042 nucleotide-binding protein